MSVSGIEELNEHNSDNIAHDLVCIECNPVGVCFIVTLRRSVIRG